MINRIRVVNLDRSSDRLTRFIEQHRDVPIEKFSAVDGSILDRNTCIKDGYITSDNGFSLGALGNAMSHIALWRQCSAGSEPFHIVEDDVILRYDFRSVASDLLDAQDEWDVVLWSHNFDWPLQIRPARGVGVVVVQYDHEAVDESSLESFRLDTVKPMLTPLFSAAGTCCYSVSPRGAARMLADCLPVGGKEAKYLVKTGVGWRNTALDVEMSRHYADWRGYVAVPPLAVSDNDHSTSTIRGHLAALHDYSVANRAPR